MSQRSTARAAGKGFFVVVALCLIAVGGVAVMTFTDSNDVPLTDNTATTTTVTTRVTTTTAAPAAAVTVYDPPTTVTTTTTEPSAELFVSPLGSDVIAPFSEDPVYSKTMEDFRAHLGVDFAGEDGERVRALADGTVTASEDDPLWGGCLTIEHGGDIVSVYRGIRAAVDVGTTVQVGDDIGALGDVPCESALAPHLHLELYQGDDAIDVTTLLSTRTNSKASE